MRICGYFSKAQGIHVIRVDNPAYTAHTAPPLRQQFIHGNYTANCQQYVNFVSTKCNAQGPGYRGPTCDQFSVPLQHRQYSTYLKFYFIILPNTTSGFQRMRFANSCNKYCVWILVLGLPCQQTRFFFLFFFIQRPTL